LALDTGFAMFQMTWPLVILGSMIMFNGGVPLTQATLYALVLVGSLVAGGLAATTVAGSGANWGKETFFAVAMGALYGVMSALNVNTLLSFSLFTYLYGAMSVCFILGMVLYIGAN
jgi:hypothetical protein